MDKLTIWIKSEDGANRVVKAVKDAILAVKYMEEPTINNYYHTQGDRVATQFAAVERSLQRNWAGTSTPYTVQGLDQQWLQFMHDYTEEVKGKFEQYLNLWSGSLARDWLPTQGEVLSPSRLTLATKVTNLVTEVNTVTGGGMFGNPF